jgi:hypothetical protein
MSKNKFELRDRVCGQFRCFVDVSKFNQRLYIKSDECQVDDFKTGVYLEIQV